MTVYKECKKRKYCAEAIYWPEKSAGCEIWEQRSLEGCRFAFIRDGNCMLYKDKLDPPIEETEKTVWGWGGSGCDSGTSSATILRKTWKNKRYKAFNK